MAVTITIEEHDEEVVRTVAGGVVLLARIRVWTASPPSLTQEQLTDLLSEVAVKDEEGRWVVEGHPALGDLESADDEWDGLVAEAAYLLNEYGVSVSDWPPYALG